MGRLGASSPYPEGSENDPNAPWNEDFLDSDYEDGEDIIDDE